MQLHAYLLFFTLLQFNPLHQRSIQFYKLPEQLHASGDTEVPVISYCVCFW